MYKNPRFLRKVKANVEGRDFIVGDIHGCFAEFKKLLNYVNFDPKIDRVFSTGDLIDRGPHPYECLNLLRNHWFYPVLGNHEDLFLTKYMAIKRNNANEIAKISKKEIDYIMSLEEFVPLLLEIPLAIEVEHLLLDKFYLIHAEILPEHLNNFTEEETQTEEYKEYLDKFGQFDFSKRIENFFAEHNNKLLPFKLKQEMLWSRKIVSKFNKDHRQLVENGDFSFMKETSFEQRYKIFCGHNVVPFPMKIGQQYYIDTGSALGYSEKEIGSKLFSQFGHEFFALTMVDATSGFCFACISTESRRGEIVKLEASLYEKDYIGEVNQFDDFDKI